MIEAIKSRVDARLNDYLDDIKIERDKNKR